MTYLTRAWLEAHGWVKAKDTVMFRNDREVIDCDLCVVFNCDEWMLAKFHHQGDNAYRPEAKPTTIEVTGLNNFVEMDDISHPNLVMAFCICGLCSSDCKEVGGIYDFTMTKRKI